MDHDVIVIWIKGKDVNIPIEHDSFNNNPFNDEDFVKRLQEVIKNS